MSEPDSSTPERLRALQSRWESDKTSRVFVQLAEEYRRVGRTSEALAILAEGLAANPNYLAAKVVLGRCHLDTGRTQDAIQELEAVIARDPTQMVAYKLLVEAHLVEGDGEEARKRLRIYSLLNDSDPEIAELRRRIGETGRKHRDPEDTFVGALRAEQPSDPENKPESEPLASLPPITDRLAVWGLATESAVAESPVEIPAVLEELPFPELAVEPASYRVRSPAEDIFDLAPPQAARVEIELEPATNSEENVFALPAAPIAWQFADSAPPAPASDDLFDLAVPSMAPDLDVTGLLGRSVTTKAPELPIAAEPSVFSLESEPAAVHEMAATATLGNLYLRQGHLAEAESMFREVLAREPESSAALAGLTELDSLRRPAAAATSLPLAPTPEPSETTLPKAPADTVLTAAALLLDFDSATEGNSVMAKKRHLLRGYLARLRGARGLHVR